MFSRVSVLSRMCMVVRVESDHEPLDAIFSKPLYSAPKRLQRMLLRLPKYNLQVVYKKGTQMFQADTLSRAFLPEINACDFNTKLEEVDHQAFLPVSTNPWQQIKHASADDPVLQQLWTTIREGWPESRSNFPEPLYPYFSSRDLLTVQNDLAFKGQCLVVPASLHKELMAVVHSSHIGMEGCIHRAHDTLYWPHMATELREYIAKFDICLSHPTEQGKIKPSYNMK